jgi:hypothetical protein
MAELEKDKDALQLDVDHGINDNNLLVTGNKNLSSERDELTSHCDDQHDELVKVRSDA